MLFASHALVQRIEQAETRALVATGQACRTQRNDVLTEALGGGQAVFVAPGSPFNKIAGLGFAPLDEAGLAHVEAQILARGAPVQVELSTFASPEVMRLLCRRGYVLVGFENLLGRELTHVEHARVAAIAVRKASEAELEPWLDVLATGFTHPDVSEGPAPHESFARAALERAFRDMASETSFERWLALSEGAVVGGASLRLDDRIAFLCGAATSPQHRRRGVQTALLRARLADAHARGAELAVVTTQPGSKSQENVQRAGFSLLYARAILVKEPA